MICETLPPEHELRFHITRLGSRVRVAQMLQVRALTIYRAAPVNATDCYQRGMMISIGGILAKKCPSCGVARELESYNASDNKSGCQKSCSACRNRT